MMPLESSPPICGIWWNRRACPVTENFNPSRRDLTSLNVFTIGDFNEKPRVREFAELRMRLDKRWWTKAGYAD